MSATRRIAAVFMAGVLSACATAPITPSTNEISVTHLKRYARGPEMGITNLHIEKGASVGLSSGAAGSAVAAGALASSAVCGPLFLFCAGAVGAVLATGGVLAGVAIGAAQGLDAATASRLQESLATYDRENAQVVALMSDVRTKLSDHWVLIPDGSAPTTLIVEIRRKGLELYDGHLRATLRVESAVRHKGVSKKGQPDSNVLEYVGSWYPVSQWLEGGSTFVGEQFGQANRSVARRVALALPPPN